MRKYVVPIVALLGIALLTPQSNAANLIIKSRAASAGTNVILPVAATAIGGTTQLWGLDFTLNFDTTKVGVGTDPGGNGSAFSPFPVGTEVPVVVSGTTFVGTGATNPNLYVGIVRGTSPFVTTANAVGQPTSSIGLLRLTLAATGPVAGEVIDLAGPATYNVANTGDGSTTNSRAGNTGATSDATAGSAVVAEPVTVLATMPVSGTVMSVPLHKIAVAPAGPGDVVAGGGIAVGDIAKLANGLLGKSAMTDYNKIAGDVAPNGAGYVPHTNYGGTAGLSYGDGTISVGDVALLAKMKLGTATNAPVNE
ncbi:MAG TPA: hypothetical protein VGM51_04170 [Armatimonadota bacterium]|jgi:hypothetical protein